MTKEDELTPEMFFEGLKEAFEYMKNKPVERVGTKEKPLYCMVSNVAYLETKKQKLVDENDMYRMPNGEWVKVINVDKPFEVEVKPYEPKFNNTNYKPFYHDVFKKDNSYYAVRVLGKWKK